MSFILDTSARKQTTGLEARESLLEVVKAEKDQFRSVLNEFYEQPKRSTESYYQTNEKVIDTIDRIMAAGDWEDSLFLKNTVKPLRLLRAEALEIRAKLKAEEEVRQGKRRALKENQVLVYVQLYQAGEVNINKWALVLRNLSRSVQGRPVYAEEALVNQSIRAKQNPMHQAYAVIAVAQSAVMLDQQTQEDRTGIPLVAMKEAAVQNQNILELVYLNQRYAYTKGQLHPIE